MNFWISWIHEEEMGGFELHSPWWISGSGERSEITICAAVRACSQEYAMGFIRTAYDTPPTGLIFRFVEERPVNWSPFSARFPRADWMKW